MGFLTDASGRIYQIKGAAEVLDYTLDFTTFLGGDTISTATVIPQTGITVDSHGNTSNTVTAIISGGTVASIYKITVQIVTAAGLTAEQAFYLRIA